MCINEPQGKPSALAEKIPERRKNLQKILYILLKFMQRKEALVPPKTTKFNKDITLQYLTLYIHTSICT